MFLTPTCSVAAGGAYRDGRGMGLNMFPSSASNVPVEVFELNSPSLVIGKVGLGRGRQV